MVENSRKHVTLLVCYYWPPSSGGGLMRWFKMSKYWEDKNHKLIIYTPQVDNPPGYDPTLESQIPSNLEVIKSPIWEPHKLYARFMGKKDKGVYSGFIQEEKPTWKSRLSIWIRSNLFIPDARMFWIRPSIKRIWKLTRDKKIDTIITTGPPHSMHLIGLGLKKKGLDARWIADFRDPWTEIDYADQLTLTSWSRKKNERLEKEVMSSADELVTVTWSSKPKFEQIGNRTDVQVITNGFDPADYKDLPESLDEKFTICHLGSMSQNRNPDNLWKALQEICLSDPKFKQDLSIKLIGDVDGMIIKKLKSFDLKSNLDKRDFMPHSKGLKELATSHLILLMMTKSSMSKSTIPGKAYEYLAIKRPILAIGESGSDVERVLESSPSACFFDFKDKGELVPFIKEQYMNYKKGGTQVVNKNINQYSRSQLAQDYKRLISSRI